MQEELSQGPDNRTTYWLWSWLLFAIVASALTIIRSEHKLRTEHLKVNQIVSEVDVHLSQYAQLLAEKNVLMSPYRLEREAVEKFDMQVPLAKQIRVLK